MFQWVNSLFCRRRVVFVEGGAFSKKSLHATKGGSDEKRKKQDFLQVMGCSAS